MGKLVDNIRRAVREGRFVVSEHVNKRLRERKIVAWQVATGLEKSKLLLERSDGEPHPVVEFHEELADGTPIKAVWAWIPERKVAKLVTVHFLPRAGTWRYQD